jgi:hypothetical protein
MKVIGDSQRSGVRDEWRSGDDDRISPKGQAFMDALRQKKFERRLCPCGAVSPLFLSIRRTCTDRHPTNITAGASKRINPNLAPEATAVRIQLNGKIRTVRPAVPLGSPPPVCLYISSDHQLFRPASSDFPVHR